MVRDIRQSQQLEAKAKTASLKRKLQPNMTLQSQITGSIGANRTTRNTRSNKTGSVCRS